jgi:hypothetical protein
LYPDEQLACLYDTTSPVVIDVINSQKFYPLRALKWKLGQEIIGSLGNTIYINLIQDKTDWPTIMFESGFSESLGHLRNDAKWWLANSQGEVKIAVIIAIQPADKKLHIEKWELVLPHEATPVTQLT